VIFRGRFPMDLNTEPTRYVFHTKGVCPPEIHFERRGDSIHRLRFVGGGCPGNAQLVSRLVEGHSLEHVIDIAGDIPCRNGTSCPDQLAEAVLLVLEGKLEPAPSFRVFAEETPRRRVGLIGDLGGDPDALKRLLGRVRSANADSVFCLGNLTGLHSGNHEVIRLASKEGIITALGELDWLYAQGKESEDFPPLDQQDRDRLFGLPNVIAFQLGARRGMAFFGDYLQKLPGYSDFDPYAIEMNMVCSLTCFMKDETVFPALEAMAPQFQAKIVLFGQRGDWGHCQVGGVHFISVGSSQSGRPAVGILEDQDGVIHFETLDCE
jgi:uncharacterized protein (TIGR03905 family)